VSINGSVTSRARKKMAKRTCSQLSPSRGQTEKLQKNELKMNHKDDKSGLVP